MYGICRISVNRWFYFTDIYTEITLIVFSRIPVRIQRSRNPTPKQLMPYPLPINCEGYKIGRSKSTLRHACENLFA